MRLTGGLLVSMVSLWFAALDGWTGEQINRNGRRNLHCAMRGTPGMKNTVQWIYMHSSDL